MDRILLGIRWKQLFILFVFGVLIGCIFFHVLWRVQGDIFYNEWNILLDSFVKVSLKNMYLRLWNFRYLLFFFHILICAMGIIKIGKIVIQGLCVCWGMIIGSLQTLLLLSFDLKTGLLFELKLCIIFFPYILLSGGMGVISCTMSFLLREAVNKTKKWKHIQYKKFIINVVVTLFFHMVYIIFMNYVNFGKISLKIL